MANARSAWGIDIGNRALKAVKLVREGDRLRVDDVEVIEHEQILSTAGDNKDSFVQAALANFVQRHSTKGSIVGISVSGQSSFARFIKLPPVEPKKIPEIVKFEAIQQIPFPLEDVEWGYQLFQDPESPDIEVGIFAMRKELVNAHIKQFTDLEMNVQVVQMGPLAVYNGMQYDHRLADGTTMIVDCGSENTDLIIADGETVWLRTISIGGNNFTEALTKSFKLNFPKAEELKRNASTSKYQRQIFQAMRPVFADLVSEIQRSIGFYGTVHRDSRIKRIIALGSTFRLPTLQKYLQQNLQVEVERIDGFSGGAPSDGRLGALLNENVVSLGTAYGLAVQAMGDSKISSSLLPEPIRKAKIWKEKVPYFGMAAAMFVAGTVGIAAKWYLDKQTFEQKDSVRQKIDSTIQQANSADTAWAGIQDNGAADRKRIRDVREMRVGWDVWPKLITDLSAAVPPQPVIPDPKKAPPREKREQIVIDSIVPEYRSSMADVLRASDNEFKNMGAATDVMPGEGAIRTPVSDAGADPSGGRAEYRGRRGEAAPPPEPSPTVAVPSAGAPVDSRGFLLTVRCTTPNAGASTYVQDTLVKSLLKLNALDAYTQKKPYYIAKASIVAVTKVKEDPSRGNGAPASGGVAPAFNGNEGNFSSPARTGRRGDAGRVPIDSSIRSPRSVVPIAPPAAGDAAAPVVPFPDPQTGEDMGDDTSLIVRIAVVLDPPPPAPAVAGSVSTAK
jgi:type IV pilus assembly protein PilM